MAALGSPGPEDEEARERREQREALEAAADAVVGGDAAATRRVRMEAEEQDEPATRPGTPEEAPDSAAGAAVTAASGKGVATLPAKKVRSREAEEREQDRRRLARTTSERSNYGKAQLRPQGRQDWNGRHDLVYDNTGMNPNNRSYFDRQIEAQVLDVKPAGGVLKPVWRLNPEAESPEQRAATKKMAQSYSPNGPPHRNDAASAPPPPVDRRSLRVDRDRSWVSPQVSLQGEARRPAPGGGGWGDVYEDGESRCGNKALAAAAEAAELARAAETARGAWNGNHHITWCNERNCGGSLLNPAPLRCYFGRWRNPSLAARSAQLKSPQGEGGVATINRVLPTWRLEPVPGGGPVPDPETPLPRPPALAAKSGTGGSNTNTRGGGSGGSPSGSLLESRMSSRQRRKEQVWNTRHALTFKNEEVSKLDRSYFDRWREPEMATGKKQSRGSVQVWSLERSGSPEEEAKRVWVDSERRCGKDGRWDLQHHITFDNGIHQNLKSYFDRQRFPADPRRTFDASASAETAEGTEEAPCRSLTLAAEGRRRAKLTEKEKLLVFWKLQESSPKASDYSESLRRCESDTATFEAQRNERRRSAWFSSHGSVF
mmetsp:Transcript_65240/g.144158  ORF Transcript_65240/g.144158 Transcript_65240/m.144158 type:complete len:601 (+) Transcript_65240:86-1888(+)